MMDWVHSSPPWCPAGEMQVWMNWGDVRTANVIPTLDYSNLFFTDCNHALQNAYCPRESVRAWRYVAQMAERQ